MTFTVFRTYRLTLGSSPERTPINLSLDGRNFGRLRLVFYATSCGHVLFGDSTVSASKDVDGDKKYPEGQIELIGNKLPSDYNLISDVFTHVSVVRALKNEKGEDITSNGEVTIQIGY